MSRACILLQDPLVKVTGFLQLAEDEYGFEIITPSLLIKHKKSSPEGDLQGEIKQLLQNGLIIPSELLNQLFQEKLMSLDGKAVLFHNFPKVQVKMLVNTLADCGYHLEHAWYFRQVDIEGAFRSLWENRMVKNVQELEDHFLRLTATQESNVEMANIMAAYIPIETIAFTPESDLTEGIMRGILEHR